MTQTRQPRYKGVFPVVPTTFHDNGELDLASQKRCVDFMIDAGSHGLCILANFSEQFLLSDDEREVLTRTILDYVAGRVPVIVTTIHFSSLVCAARSRRAQDMGAGRSERHTVWAVGRYRHHLTQTCHTLQAPQPGWYGDGEFAHCRGGLPRAVWRTQGVQLRLA